MPRILFVELLGGIGDVLIALPAIQALGRSYPTATLSVLTFQPGGQLLEHDPLVHQVIYAPRGQARQTVEQLLQDQSFDLIVSDTSYDGIDQLLQSSTALRVITNLWQSPPANQFVGERFVEILVQTRMIRLEAIAPTQLHFTRAELQQAQAALHALPTPRVVMIPDAGMAIKQWPVERYVQLGQILQARYGATLIVPVGDQERRAADLVHGIGYGAQLWQRGSLRQLAAMMTQVDLVIAPDTGTAHIAAALNVPTVTLFGPSWHQRYGHAAPHRNLQGFPDCPERLIHNFTEQPCWYSGICPFEHRETCLDAIAVNDVMAALEPLLVSRLGATIVAQSAIATR